MVHAWSADAYNQKTSFVYSNEYVRPVLDLLDAKEGDRIIDFGCGTGEVTLGIERVVGEKGVVVGVDASDDMIEKAKKNGLRHCFVADIQSLDLSHASSNAADALPPSVDAENPQFDAVFSNAALHWCKSDPEGVIQSAEKLLKRPGGRFVAEMGGFANIVGLRLAIYDVLRRRGYDPLVRDPWYFPSVQEYRTLLERNGFQVHHISLNPRLTPLTGSQSLVDWMSVFCRTSFFKEFSDEEVGEITREVEEMCKVDCKDSDGGWVVMYTRLRFACTLV